MARNSESVASALNRLTDMVFVDALSAGDQSAVSDLVADFFFGDPDTDISDSEEEEEPGNWHYNLTILIMKSTKVQTLGRNIGTFGLETPICMHMY